MLYIRNPLDFFTRHPKCLLLKKRSLVMASRFAEAIWLWQKQDWNKVMEETQNIPTYTFTPRWKEGFLMEGLGQSRGICVAFALSLCTIWNLISVLSMPYSYHHTLKQIVYTSKKILLTFWKKRSELKGIRKNYTFAKWMLGSRIKEDVTALSVIYFLDLQQQSLQGKELQ